MSINQISTSNTFGQWLTTTQALVTKWNTLEETTNLVFDTANSTIDVFNNTVNVYIDTVEVLNETTNVYNDILSYVNTAFDTANTVLIISQNAYDVSNNASDVANGALEIANLAIETSNTFFENIFSIEDKLDDANTYYPTFVINTVGVPEDVYISSTKFTFNPSTGTLNTQNLIASGLIQAQDFNSTSDISLKENIEQIENPLTVIGNLTGIKFNWKDSKEVSYGLSAQEVEQILPDIVKTRENGLKGVNYLNIIAILIESVKELRNEIENLKNNK